MSSYLVLFLIWSAYLASHSLLASTSVKNYFSGWKHYRLAYTIVSVLGFFLALGYMATMPPIILIQAGGKLKYTGMVLASWGVMTVFVAFRQMSIWVFLGLKQEPEKGTLIRSGAHAYVRHPIYSGTMLILIGMVLYVGSLSALVTTLTIFLYLPFGIYFEEKKLIQIYGDEYLEYKSEVKAVIPWIL